MKNPVMLAVLAHPDDESFGMGGTLALYARRGWDVYLVCATRGEVGDVDQEKMKGFDSIAELRAGELRCAASHLGLKDFFFLGYRDSGMPGSPDNLHPDAQVAHPLDEVAGRVVRYIRELKPEIVLTFDPIGGYRHPDHIHIHEATVLAFEKAADPDFHPEAGAPWQPGRLYFHIFPKGVLKLGVAVMPLIGQDPGKLGRNHDIDLKSIARVEFPTHAKVDITSVRAVKAAAGACHDSQGGRGLSNGFIELFYKLFGERESYMQAYPAVADGWQVKHDLAQ